ncbi:MAG: ATP synthase F1 subunit epsilon [Bacteroidales bacterium]|jgi:F-type H+-transporting ATPase subunit epsilon|nr:ATP synthase F1 subunit epsilon [Bacteroidales bacterium]MDD3161654.1 ATP synthase F1 subunit epsilon [Bacteroidales bacterium]
MKLHIYTPDKILYDGDTDSVTIPGMKGSFTILKNHAPLISSINKGVIKYKVSDTEEKLSVNSGFVEVRNNVITICAEINK